MELKILACFADNADLPIACSEDIGEEYNCQHLVSGETKANCYYWKPERTMELCRELLGFPAGIVGRLVFDKGGDCR